ncbi:MAG: septum formation inhibitor Maf [Oscillospiraceae bacterium]|nr:septum formation inhibitor Maf [Oscillospiraceae bacterium]
MNIVLASGSPRRKELMEMLGVENLKILPAKGEERPPEHAGPEELVMALAAAKAREVAAVCGDDDLVIGADTIVWFEDRPFGKPHSRQQAVDMLHMLSGQTHRVYTGVAIVKDGQVHTECEESRVRFRPLTEEEIQRYVDTGEPMDKAGAYGAQGKGALFVEGIDGDFFNVMGLPLCRLGLMLRKQGVEIL